MNATAAKQVFYNRNPVNVINDKPLKITLPIDILALSIQHRLDNNTDLTSSFLSGDVCLTLSDHSLQLAKEIRDYYRQKLSMLVLKGGELTAFRKKMYRLVAEEVLNEISDDEIGALIRLYDFYHEDLAIEKLLNQTTSADPNIRYHTPIIDVYTFLTSVDRITRHSKQKRYFFKNSRDQLGWFQVEYKSQAIPVLNYVFKNNKKYKIVSTPTPSAIAGYNDDFFALHIGNNFELID